MSTQHIPERDNEFGRHPVPKSQDGEKSMAFLLTYATYFIVAIVVITLAVLMTR
ncbi:hypothetical protein [Rubinisphaera sp.]|uniref:hypothetical protein n=1 Tax=Rubinisphaera sp. TaxID=2024857 RepID=UPI0025E19E64|nr:hypothetical protein [Rubinisphaera sp.]